MILHIPHASTQVPTASPFSRGEISTHCDYGTDLIFDVPGATRIVYPYSRYFCDVERFFDDALEPMAALGRGWFYTKTADGISVDRRRLDRGLAKKSYWSHHGQLTRAVEEEHGALGSALIIDCHSFNNRPAPFEHRTGPSLDICLGTDSFHTRPELTAGSQAFFTARGFSVALNDPYGGTMVPLEYYRKNPGVQSIMIEINKRLYLADDGTLDMPRALGLRRHIQDYAKEITTWI